MLSRLFDRGRDERRTICDDPAAHDAKVERIRAQLRAHDGSRPLSLRKRAVAHQVPKRGDLRRRDDKIDISDLDRVLRVDPVERICVAEPGVTFVDLVAVTMRYGLVPIVVPELSTITIGGAVSGCSIESTSFRHGGFHDTCLEYEVITATGEVLTCTPHNEHALVFQMLHGAFGTLGILSKLTFKLMPAKPFVKLSYERYAHLDEYLTAIRRHADRGDLDFMDGMIFGPTEHVIAIGRFVDEAPYTSRYDWLKVYYQSMQTRREDYMTTPDYFFRYDRGVTNVRPRSFLGRLLFGKLVASSEMLRLAEKANWIFRKEHPTITLDVFVPMSKVPEFIAWYREEFRHFPLWVVPYRRVRDYEWVSDRIWETLDDELFVDLAIYGMRQPRDRNYHKLMEDKLRELGGIKTLISHNYYSEADFWQTWNKPNYDRVKAIVDPRNLFRDLYVKTCKAAMGIA